MDKIDERANWFLNERIQFLSRDKNESYHEYLTALITRATATPELIRVNSLIVLIIRSISEWTSMKTCPQRTAFSIYLKCSFVMHLQ